MRVPLVAVSLVLALSACTPAVSLTTRVHERPVLMAQAAPLAAQTDPQSAEVPSYGGGGRGASVTHPRPDVLPVEAPAPPVGSFVLGDSISLTPGVGPVLSSLGYTVVGVQGQSATDYYLSSNLSSSTAQAAPAWVIELGTNNSGSPATVAQLSRWIELIDSLRVSAQHVYWVLPYRPPTYGGGQADYNLDAFDAELIRLAGERPWLTTLDFAALARENLQWFEEDAAMHVHPDAAGQAALLRLIAG
jgi:hypothetical protein